MQDHLLMNDQTFLTSSTLHIATKHTTVATTKAVCVSVFLTATSLTALKDRPQARLKKTIYPHCRPNYCRTGLYGAANAPLAEVNLWFTPTKTYNSKITGPMITGHLSYVTPTLKYWSRRRHRKA